jgi:RimJ/RimL family protein N-acetyltransferase
MEEFQKRGYATEAVGGLLKWAFSHTPVTRVIAETYPTIPESINVMVKSGFVFIGDGSEAGVIRYELTREAFLSK